MLYIFLFLFISPASVQDTIDISSQTNEQITYYVKSLDNSEGVAQNLWALDQVAKTNCDLSKTVQDKIVDESTYSKVFQQYNCSNSSKNQIPFQNLNLPEYDFILDY